MKMTSIFKKTTVVALAILLTLLTVISVLPLMASAGDKPVYSNTITSGTDSKTRTISNLGEKLSAINIVQAGNVKMLFYYTSLDKFDNTDDYIEITVPQKNGTEKVTQILKKDLAVDGKGRTVVEVKVPAAQMTDLIKLQWIKVDGNTETSGYVRELSVRAYADKILATPGHAMEKNIKSMLNYGAMAQTAFGHNVEKLANEGLYSGGNPIDNMTVDSLYDVVKNESDNTNSIKFESATAFLQESVQLRLHFTAPDGAVANIKRNGEYVMNGTKKAEFSIHTDAETGLKYVNLNNIAANNYDVEFTVEITANGETASRTYSVLEYALSTLNNYKATDAEKNTAKAIYLYYAWTKNYVSKGSFVPGPKNCTHTRSHLENGKLICSDCGSTGISTKLSFTATPVKLTAGQATDVTFTVRVDGTVNLSTLVFTLKSSSEDLTLTYKSASWDGVANGVAGEAEKNVALDIYPALTEAGVIANVTYTVTAAKTGEYTITPVVREAYNASGADITATITATAIAFKATNANCGKISGYAISGTGHQAYCDECQNIFELEAHSYSAGSTTSGGKLYANTKVCKCGHLAADSVVQHIYDLGFTLDNNGNKIEKAPLLVLTPSNIKNMSTTRVVTGDIAEDGSYITLYNDQSGSEGYLTVFGGKNDPYGVTGQYLMIKYRTTHTANMQIFYGANNGKTGPQGSDNFYLASGSKSLVANGEWQTVIVDLSKIDSTYFKAESDGTYKCDYIRWDIFNSNPKDSKKSVDVAYIAMSDDIMSLASFAGNDIYTACNSATKGADNTIFAVGSYMASTKTLNPFFNASWLDEAKNISSSTNINAAVDTENGGLHYVSITRKDSSTGSDHHMYVMGNGQLGSGQIAPTAASTKYIAVLYRKHVDNGASDGTQTNRFQFLINSNSASATGSGDTVNIKAPSYKVDKQWHFALADLSGILNRGLITSTGIQSLRFDYHDAIISDGDTNLTDVAFIAFFSTEEEAYEYMSKYAETYLNAEGGQGCKHDATYRNSADCSERCEYCDAKIKASHVEGTTWVAVPGDPQKQTSSCKDCGITLNTRATDSTLKGLTLYTPDELMAAADNKTHNGVANFSELLITQPNGFKFYRVESLNGAEGYVTLNAGSTAVKGVGQYMAVMARKTTQNAANITKGTIEIWANNVAGNSNTTGAKSPDVTLNASTTSSNEWTVLVFDFGSGYLTDSTGVFWNRLDILNGEKVAGDIVEVAWVGFFNSKADAYEMFDVYRAAYLGCDHHNASKLTNVKDIADTNSLYTVTADCTACGAKNVKVTLETIEGLKFFAPGELLEKYKVSDSTANGNVLGGTSFKLVVNDESVNNMPYVRYTYNNTDGSERYMRLDNSGKLTGVGNYAAILFRRTSTGGNNATTDYFQILTNDYGTTGSSGFKAKTGSHYAQDGKWICEVFDIGSTGKLSADGLGWTRLDIFNDIYTEGKILDIAYLAFFSTEEEAQNFYHAYIREYLGQENCPSHTYGNSSVTEANGKVSYVTTCTICGHIFTEFTADSDRNPNVVISPADIYNSFSGVNSSFKSFYSSIKLMQDEDGTGFIRFYGNDTQTQSYFNLYKPSTVVETGRYLVYRYRLPANGLGQDYVRFFASTVNSGMTGGDDSTAPVVERTDGEWYTVVIDLAKVGKSFTADGNGKYSAKYIRFDPFGKWSNAENADDYFDLQFVTISDDITDYVSGGSNKFSENTSYYDRGTGILHSFDQFNGLMSWHGDEAIGGQTVTEANGLTYNKYISSSASEQSETIYSSSTKLTGVSDYIAIIYRAPKTVIVNGNRVDNEVGGVETFVHSTATGAQPSCSKSGTYSVSGTWNVVILDLSAITTAYDPATGLASLRLDYFNTNSTLMADAELHIAAIGFVKNAEAGTAWYNEFINTYYPNGQTEYVTPN